MTRTVEHPYVSWRVQRWCAGQTRGMREVRRPEAVVFDVVETMFSLGRVGDALAEAGQPTSTELFFTRLLRDAFALGSAGRYRPFTQHADAALSVVAPALGATGREQVLAAFGDLDVHQDVIPAFEHLRAQGVRVATLSNGAAPATVRLLDRHGLIEHVELVISVDEVQVWKPQPAPYRHALERLGLPAERVAMVAVHAWDLHGARNAGLVTGWASRLEGTYSPVFDPPDVSGVDLVEVVEGLLVMSA